MKALRKTLLSSLVLILALTVLLVGCSSGNDEESTTTNESESEQSTEQSSEESTTQESIDLQFYTDNPNWVEAITKTGAAIKDKTGIGFKDVTFSDVNTYKATVKQALQSDNPPDLLKWWSHGQMTELVEADELVDLTEEWQQHYAAKGLDPAKAAPFTIDGKTYAIPAGYLYWVVFYNTKVFEQYNLTPPKTWSELEQINETLIKNGIAPFAQTVEGEWPGFVWYEELMARSDPDLYDQLNKGQAKYTDPRVVKVFELWKSLIDKGWFAEVKTQTEIAQDMAQGKTAMFLFGQWYNGQLQGAGLTPGEDYSAFFMPNVNPDLGPIAIYETAAIAVPKGPNEEKVKEALRTFFDTDVITIWNDGLAYPPYTTGTSTSNPMFQTISDAVAEQNPRLVDRFWEGTPSDLALFNSQQFVKFILKPDSYMEVLQTIEDNAAKYWAANK